MKTQAERLAYAIRASKLTQAEFAQYLGYSQALISMMVNGRAPMSKECAVRIWETHGINYQWLLDGTGTPFDAPEYVTAPPTTQSVTTTQQGRPPAWVLIYPARCSACSEVVKRGDEVCPTCRANLRWPEDAK